MALFLRLGRSPIGRSIIRWIITHMSFAIPVHRLQETSSLVAFHHPKPAYPLHILLVPKKGIPSLTDMNPADTAFLSDLISTVQSLVSEFNLEKTGYRLIVNGGNFQDFPQLHFHLISDALPEHREE